MSEKEIDHDWTDHPVCPYCGKAHEDIDSPWEGKCECWGCGKMFFCEPSYSVDYSTKQVDCWNGAPHDMRKNKYWDSSNGNKELWSCVVCRGHQELREPLPASDSHEDKK